MLFDTIQRLQHPAIELWLLGDGPASAPAFKQVCQDWPQTVFQTQCDGDLGARMAYGQRMAFAGTSLSEDGQAGGPLSVHLVGTDCPTLSWRTVTEAEQRLQRDDVVLTPALDGGYVMLSTCCETPEAFARVEWGSSQVLEQTRKQVQGAGRRVGMLEAHADVDTAADLRWHLARLRNTGMACSPTIT